MFRIVAGLTLTLVLAIASFANAQTAEPKVVESIEVSIANLDVTVVDRHGNPVQGLGPSDFEVIEDGKTQEITNFTEYAAPTVTSSQSLSTRGGPSGEVRPSRDRLVAIIIDIEEIEHVRRKQFFEGLRAFLKSEQRPRDRTAVFVWYRRLRTVVPPTTDLDAVDATLVYFEKTPKWNERQVAQTIKEQAIEGAEVVAAALNDPASVEVEKEFQEMIIAEERCMYLKRKLEAIRELIASFGSLDLQKVLILASDDLSAHPEKNCVLLANVVSLAAVANSYGFTIHGFHPPGARFMAADLGYRYPKTRDLPQNSETNQKAFDESEGLSILAKETGGEFAIGAPLSLRALETVSSTLDNYYSIGYRLKDARPNVARRVTVRMKNKSWTARTRRTLVEFSDDRRISDAVVSSLYTEARPKTTFAITASARNIARNGREIRIRVAVSVPIKSLSLLPDGNGNVAGRFTVHVTAGREIGDASPVGHMEQRFTRPASSVGENERVEYEFDMNARSTTRRVALAVRDEVTREYGIATIDVKLPDS